MEGNTTTIVKVKRAPTLYAIIVAKILKGLLFATLALAAYMISDNNLPDDYQRLFHEFNQKTHINLNPEKQFWVDIETKVNNLTEARMVHIAVGTLIYSLFALVEGVGLMFRVPWAGWLSIGESAFFIPIEVFELLHRFTWVVFAIMIFNIFIVWYLFQNRARLFKHHYEPQIPPAVP
jgi:uncharacterized membrane protein (DUF2068 family)